MKTNMHNMERVARVVIGVAVLSLLVVGPQTWWGLLGIIPIFTGLIGFCPLYTVFGFSTCPAYSENHQNQHQDKKKECCGGGCHTKKTEAEMNQDAKGSCH